MEAQSSSSTAQPARLSRYRSVRRAISKEENAPPVPVICPDVVSHDNQVKRAPSRYRRPTRPTVHNVPLPVINIVEKPVSVQQQVVQEVEGVEEETTDAPRQQLEGLRTARTFPSSADRYRRPTQPLQYPGAVSVRPRERAITTSGSTVATIPKTYDEARLEARLILENEQERLRRLKEQQEQAERQRRLRQEKELAAQVANVQSLPPPPEPTLDSKEKEEKTKQPRRWTIGRSSQSADAPRVAQSKAQPPSQETEEQMRTSSGEEQKQRSSVSKNSVSVPRGRSTTLTSKIRSSDRGKEPEPIVPTAGTDSALQISSIMPEHQVPKLGSPPKAIDVPVSAINAGERRVELRLDTTIITLPVTPSTTARDLLNSASVVMSQSIDPRTSVLVEVYRPLDLERPLRHYEHIRDVMNSWDSDGHNHLNIMRESECDTTGLNQNDAPPRQPQITAVNLYHSQRPGKWDRRWLLLKPDGQVTVSKDEHDRNARNVFHLSDFDVYMPTAKQTKKMKPPKKICFAVKSQQRSVVFEDTTNFVHFFSTSDKAIADQWYQAVQRWRSWYLVNVLLGSAKPPNLQLALGPLNNVPSQELPSTPRSVDTVPYQLGTFKPLLDFSADAFSYGDENTKKTSFSDTRPANFQHTSGPRQHTPPYGSSQGALIDNVRNRDNDFQINTRNAEGTANLVSRGILGRHVSVKKAQSMDSTDGAFTGRGLLAQHSSRQLGNDARRISEDANNAFTGNGLLSRSFTKKKSFSARPGQPLVNLAEHSEFVNGSLLQQVEAFGISHGAYLPVIDRSKGVEVMDKTGEF